MKDGPRKLQANETEDTVWFSTPAGAKYVSFQVVGPVAWATAVYKVVGRVDPECVSVDLPGAKFITAAQPYSFQVNIHAIRQVGLKLSTPEGSTLELQAFAFFGE